MYVAVGMPNKIALSACLANTSPMELREYRRHRPKGRQPWTSRWPALSWL